MKNSARHPSMAACGSFTPPMIEVALRVRRGPSKCHGPPAQEPPAEVGDQDRQLVVERRDFEFQIDRVALIRPQEHLEDVLVPQVHEVLVHGRGELAVRPFNRTYNPSRRVEHLEARVVGIAVRPDVAAAPSTRPAARRMIPAPGDLEVLHRPHRQARPIAGLSVHAGIIAARGAATSRHVDRHSRARCLGSLAPWHPGTLAPIIARLTKERAQMHRRAFVRLLAAAAAARRRRVSDVAAPAGPIGAPPGAARQSGRGCRRPRWCPRTRPRRCPACPARIPGRVVSVASDRCLDTATNAADDRGRARDDGAGDARADRRRHDARRLAALLRPGRRRRHQGQLRRLPLRRVRLRDRRGDRPSAHGRRHPARRRSTFTSVSRASSTK